MTYLFRSVPSFADILVLLVLPFTSSFDRNHPKTPSPTDRNDLPSLGRPDHASPGDESGHREKPLVRQPNPSQTRLMGLPYMPISWSGARGVNVGIYSSPMECMGMWNGYDTWRCHGAAPWHSIRLPCRYLPDLVASASCLVTFFSSV